MRVLDINYFTRMLVHSRMYVCAYYMLAQVCNYYVCHSMAMRDVQLFFQTEYAYGVHCASTHNYHCFLIVDRSCMYVHTICSRRYVIMAMCAAQLFF